MGKELILTIAAGIPVVAAAWATGRWALKAKREEAARPDWSGFSERLERTVAAQGQKIDELYVKLSELRSEVRAYERRHDIMLAYLRQVLAWAVPQINTPPPEPPSELSDELRHWQWK